MVARKQPPLHLPPMTKRILVLAAIFLLTACAPGGGEATVMPHLLRVQYTAAAQPWLNDMYDCAKQDSGPLLTVEQRSASDLDLESADVLLRLGEPEALSAQDRAGISNARQ